MKKIQIERRENTPTNYLVVRVQLVHVKKKLLGLKDTEITKFVAIPNTMKESVELTNRIGAIMKKYGKSFPLDRD